LPRIRALAPAKEKPHNLDPVIGWTYRGPASHREANCQGTVVEYSFDPNGARTYTGYDGKKAEIIVVGDSYTHGSEVADDDFWSKPKHQFPFSVSYIRALGSNYFYFKRLSRKLRKIGVPEYLLAYRSGGLSSELVSLLEQYSAFAGEKDLMPIVLFIPRDKYDTKSVSKFIENNKVYLPRGLLIGDVGNAEIEWDRYNLIETKDGNDVDFCHPSPYGYGKIAEYVADLLNGNTALDPQG
jgi:hypothetical protein